MEGGRGCIPGEDVVGDGGDVVLVAEGLAEGQHEGSFARSDGSTWVS